MKRQSGSIFLAMRLNPSASFDPLTQVTTERLERFHLGPISEVLLDERAIAHFRSGYRELFGAVTDSDPLYEAVTAGRKFPGVEHWLGLFYPKLYSLFDYLPQRRCKLRLSSR